VRAAEDALAGVLEHPPKVWVSIGLDVVAISRGFFIDLIEAFLGDANVNSGGPTTFLWIKQLFGFCGELW
jgi:hypothetical protein